jgi:hypothetical protein
MFFSDKSLNSLNPNSHTPETHSHQMPHPQLPHPQLTPSAQNTPPKNKNRTMRMEPWGSRRLWGVHDLRTTPRQTEKETVSVGRTVSKGESTTRAAASPPRAERAGRTSKEASLPSVSGLCSAPDWMRSA